MRYIEITMTELRQGLGALVNRAAYGGERIVLMAHGVPRAALIGIEDLNILEQRGQHEARSSQQGPYTEALAAAHSVRERLHRWQAEHGIQPEESAGMIRELREERDDEILGLR